MSATSVGQIGLDLVINKKKFNKQLSGLDGVAKKAGAKIGAAIAAGLSIKAFTSFTKSCLDLGSDLTEIQNVVDTAFPQMSSRVDAFAKSAATSFGLSETMAKKYVGTFGAMSNSFGFTEKEAYAMSTALTGLAGDIASFYNINQDEAYTKLKSVFTGETETLKDLGVVMTQTNLDQYALANGFGKTTSAMTEQEKVALRYQFVMSRLSITQGDFAKTSNTWANQVRILTLQFESFKAAMGQGFINILTPVIQGINFLMSKLVSLANTFKAFTELLTGKKSKGTSLIKNANAADKLASSADNAAGSVGGIGKSAEKAAKKLKRALFGFDQINKVDAQESTTGSSGSGGASGAGTAAIDTGLDTALDEQNKKVLSLGKGYEKLKGAIENLKKSFSGLVTVLKSGGKWVLDNVLKPLGQWTMQKLAPKLVNALAGAFDLLSAVLKASAPIFASLWNVLGKPLAKIAGSAVEKFLQLLTKAFTGLADAIEKHPKLFQSILTTVMGLKSISVITGHINKFRVGFLNAGSAGTLFMSIFAKKLPKATKGISTFAGHINGFRVSVRNAGSVAGAFAERFPGIAKKAKGAGAVLKTLFKAKSPIILGIMAAVAAGILLYKNWDKIKKIAKKIGTAIVKPFKSVANFFKKTWKNALKKASDVVEDMRDRVKGVVEGLKTYFGGWIDFITGVFSGNWEQAWEGVKEIFNGIWETIKEALNLPDIDVVATLSAIKDAAFDKVSEAWHAIKDKAAELLASAKEKVSGAIEKLSEKWGTIRDRTAELLADAKEKVAGTIAAIKDKWEAVKDRVATLTADAKEKSKNVLSTLKKSWDAIKTKTATITAKATNKNKNTLKSLKSSWASIKSKTVTLKAKVSASVTNIKSWINKNIIGALNSKLVATGLWKKGPIPKLAQGGYVRKNTPQLAMIGDNRHQGEVVAPEDKLLQMAKMAAAMSGGGTSPEVITLLKAILTAIETLDLEVYLDGKAIKKRVVDLINANTKATGVCEVNV